MATDVRAEFGRATALHREGRLDDAVAIYRRLLKSRPGMFEVQRLLVFGLLQTGRAKEAHAAARKAREVHPSNPHAHVMLGAALQSERKWDRALAAFETAARLDPGLVEAHYLAGNMLATLGRHAEAASRFDRVVALDPRAVEARANRSIALSLIGRLPEALADCEALVELQPWEPGHFVAKGGILLELGRFAEATAAAEEALRLKPNLAAAHFLKGQGLAGQDELAAARAAFAAALTGAPDRPAYQAALARTERLLGNLGAARDLCETVLARNPAADQVLEELAQVRQALEQLVDRPSGGDSATDAEAPGEEPPQEVPADSAAPESAAVAREGMHETAREMADIRRALEALPFADAGAAQGDGHAGGDADPPAHEPPIAEALYRRAITDLAEGRWAEGWAGYEHRAALVPPPYRTLPFPRWTQGPDPAELVIVGEGEAGEQILFARLLRMVADRGIRATLLTAPPLVRLLARIDARVAVVSDLPAAPEREGLQWAPLASLPALIAPDPAAWPRLPYLAPDPVRVARWSALRGEGFRVGIGWQDAPATGESDGNAPLAAFAPLAALDGVTLVSLKADGRALQLETCPFAERIERLPEDFDADGGYLDAAALLQHVDLVVTGDPALAHLCGARAVPAIAVLPEAPHWSWGAGGEACPFYPSVRVLRREPGEAWVQVLARAAATVGATSRGAR